MPVADIVIIKALAVIKHAEVLRGCMGDNHNYDKLLLYSLLAVLEPHCSAEGECFPNLSLLLCCSLVVLQINVGIKTLSAELK